MNQLTKFYLTMLNSVAIYSLLTLPHLLKMFFDWGLIYPLYLLVSIGLISPVLSIFLTNYEEKIVNRRKSED